MFIKVNADRKDQPFFINSDNVNWIDPKGKLYFCNGEALYVTPESAEYVLICVEANTALMSTAEQTAANALPPPSLATRIAQALRYDFAQGAILADLKGLIKEGESLADIDKALQMLTEDHVLHFDGAAYFHAANVPTKTDISANPGELFPAGF
jgi:hypothetical protein